MGEPTTRPVTYPSCTFGIRQTLSSLDSGWQRFPGRYLLYASRGGFHLEIDQAHWFLPPQRAAWVAPDERIRIWADRPVTSSSVLFARTTPVPVSPTCSVFAVTPLVREMILHAMRWPIDRNPDDELANSFFAALAAVTAELAQEPERFWLPKPNSTWTGSLTEHIGSHLADNLSLSTLAKKALVSERTLSRRFREDLGMSLGQYVHRARMLAALDRLAGQDLSVSEIAWSLGFESLSSFVTAFRTFAEETPTQYRRRILGERRS